jgi:hypothetical protein
MQPRPISKGLQVRRIKRADEHPVTGHHRIWGVSLDMRISAPLAEVAVDTEDAEAVGGEFVDRSVKEPSVIPRLLAVPLNVTESLSTTFVIEIHLPLKLAF